MDIIEPLKRAFAGITLDQMRRDTIELAMGNIALLQQRLTVIEQENQRLNREIARLQDLIKTLPTTRLPNCPFCGVPAWRLHHTEPMANPILAQLGAQLEHYQCDACGGQKTRSNHDLPQQNDDRPRPPAGLL